MSYENDNGGTRTHAHTYARARAHTHALARAHDNKQNCHVGRLG